MRPVLYVRAQNFVKSHQVTHYDSDNMKCRGEKSVFAVPLHYCGARTANSGDSVELQLSKLGCLSDHVLDKAWTRATNKHSYWASPASQITFEQPSRPRCLRLRKRLLCTSHFSFPTPTGKVLTFFCGSDTWPPTLLTVTLVFQLFQVIVPLTHCDSGLLSWAVPSKCGVVGESPSWASDLQVKFKSRWDNCITYSGIFRLERKRNVYVFARVERFTTS